MDKMSSNLSTMPGCAGTMEPIEGWIRKGYTCLDCAWEDYCLDYSIKNSGKNVEPFDLMDIEVPEQT